MSGVALSSGVPRPEEANVVLLESQDFRKPAGVLLHFSRVSSFDEEQLFCGMVARPNCLRFPVRIAVPPRLENKHGYHHLVELPAAPLELKKVGLKKKG